MAKPIKKLYVPDSIPNDYNYMIVNSNGKYYDLYNTKYVPPYSTVKFYRFYTDLDQDIYTNYDTTNNSNIQRSVGSEIRVELTNNYIYRRDFPQIFTTAFLICFSVVFLFNIITSLIKRGGVLSGLL